MPETALNALMAAFLNPLTWVVLVVLAFMVIRKVITDQREAARIAALPKLPRLHGISDNTQAQAAWLLFVGHTMYGAQLNAACLRQLKELAIKLGADGSCITNSTRWLMEQKYIVVRDDGFTVTDAFLEKFKGVRIKWPDNTA